MFDIYVAGSMTGRKISEVLKERQKARELLELNGLTYYDPAVSEGLELLSQNSVISNAFDASSMDFFIKKDFEAVHNSRCLLNLTGDLSSDGTGWEMAEMKRVLKRPVIVIGTNMFSGLRMNFTARCVDRVCPDIHSAIKAVKELL